MVPPLSKEVDDDYVCYRRPYVSHGNRVFDNTRNSFKHSSHLTLAHAVQLEEETR